MTMMKMNKHLKMKKVKISLEESIKKIVQYKKMIMRMIDGPRRLADKKKKNVMKMKTRNKMRWMMMRFNLLKKKERKLESHLNPAKKV